MIQPNWREHKLRQLSADILAPELHGYTIIEDKMSHHEMTLDHPVLSLHYFHYYSVLDRVNLQDKSHIITPVVKDKVEYDKLLPSPSDISALKKNLVVSCILVESIPALQRFAPAPY